MRRCCEYLNCDHTELVRILPKLLSCVSSVYPVPLAAGLDT